MASPSATETAPPAPPSIPARLRALPAAALDRVLRSAGQRRRLPDIRAGEDGAGLACLAMMAAWHGCAQIAGNSDAGGRARTAEPGIADMARLSHGIGLQCRPRHVDAACIDQLELPCILAWNRPAYVVLSARVGKHWLIHDPSAGPCEVSSAALMAHGRAVALEFPAASRTVASKAPVRPVLAPPRRRAPVRQCLPMIALAGLAELAWLALPFLLMALVDHVLVPGNFSSLPWLAAGVFAALAARAGLALMLHHVLAPHLAAEAVIRVARGVERQAIRKETAPPALLTRLQLAASAAMGLGFAALLDWQVAMAALAVLALHGLLVRGAQRRCARGQASLERDIGADGSVHERAAGAGSLTVLKRAGLLPAWQARLRREGLQVAAGMAERSARMAGERALQTLLLAWFAGQSLMMAGVWVQAGHSSPGAMLALLLLAWQVMRAGRPLVESLCSARESSIAKVPVRAPWALRPSPAEGNEVLALRGLHFRHAGADEWLFRDIELHLRPGETAVLAGASGAGKTSLLRLLLGELPTSHDTLQGEIRLAAPSGRMAVAAVLEDDFLLLGSVAGNIARFAPHASLADIEASARAACAHEDIMALPAGYETQVKEGGVPLPRGLVQRLLLARALHGRPALLLLDEATAMLEPAMERALLQEIAAQGIACLLVSRRMEASANMRVLHIKKPKPAS